MIIVNGKNNSVVVFGEVTQKEFHDFLNHMLTATKKWHDEGCPASGDFR